MQDETSNTADARSLVAEVVVRREPGVVGVGTESERRLGVDVGRVIAELGHARGRFGDVAIRIVGDSTMTALHARHCGIETTTDVLTFDHRRDDAIDVDIAVCVDEAARSAAARGHHLERELLLYIVHGLLHCIGYDDHEPADFAAMHAEEDRLLEAIGVGATFARDAETAP